MTTGQAPTIHLDVLPRLTRTLFSVLPSKIDLSSYYLAGGTGLALYLGHRHSVDLDFFSPGRFSESVLIVSLATAGNFALTEQAPQSVLGTLDGVKVSFLGYPYPFLEPLNVVEGVSVASLVDIACMKLDALSSRGTKRDFIDLYFVLKGVMSLSYLLSQFSKKYENVNHNPVHLKKSLLYFTDAEAEPPPSMLKPIVWAEVKKFFEHEVRHLT